MKIVVIGAGVVGASCAYALAKAGAETVIIDSSLPGRATAAGAGIISPWSSAPGIPSLDALSVGGARHYPGLIASLAEDGETDTSYRRVGAIVVSTDPAQLDEVEHRTRARAAQDASAGAVSRITAREAQELFPPLGGGLAAVHVQGGARVDGRKLAAALLRAASRHGATCGTPAGNRCFAAIGSLGSRSATRSSRPIRWWSPLAHGPPRC